MACAVLAAGFSSPLTELCAAQSSQNLMLIVVLLAGGELPVCLECFSSRIVVLGVQDCVKALSHNLGVSCTLSTSISSELPSVSNRISDGVLNFVLQMLV